MRNYIIALSILLATFTTPAFAIGPVVGGSCTFEWTEPQTNTDGSVLADLFEYRLYISQTSGAYGATPAKVIPAPLANPALGSILTTVCPPGIPQGQNYAVMTAVDLGGNASAFSIEAPFGFDTVAPGAPIQLTPKK